MITEDKQLKAYRFGIIALLIHVTGVLFGMWSDVYFWWIIGATIMIGIGYMIQRTVKDWRKRK